MVDQPRYTQPEVLQITRLRPEILQNWVNRGTIQLSEQNPGYGKRRLYSHVDVAKLALMRRLFDLGIKLETAKNLAEASVAAMKAGTLKWETIVCLRPGGTASEASAFTVQVYPPSSDPLAPYSPITGDFRNMRLDHFLGTSGNGRYDGPPDKNGMRTLNPETRAAYAAAGIHAEPVVIVPVGEIVFGALLQCDSIDEKEGRK